MSTDKHALLMEMMTASQPQIAKFARESYAELGRGIVRIGFPKPPPGRSMVAVTDVSYSTFEDMRVLADGDDAEDWAITLRMIETYDPARQAVVIATIGGELPVTVKMKLDPPVMIDGPTTVQ